MTVIHIPWWMVAWFEVKRTFLLFAMPVLIGLVVAVFYPLGQRAAMNTRSSFGQVWLLGALGPSLMLFGWMLTARTIYTAPCYGIGYGLGVALLSRVHRLRLWPFKIETRRKAGKRIRPVPSQTVLP